MHCALVSICVLYRVNSPDFASFVLRINLANDTTEYAEKDMQIPMFAASSADRSGRSLDGGYSGSRRRRLSVQSIDTVDTTDSMSQIIDSPELWREFQNRLKKSGSVTGNRANTKEVLRKFIADKGLDDAPDDDDQEVVSSALCGGRSEMQSILSTSRGECHLYVDNIYHTCSFPSSVTGTEPLE